MRIDARHNLVVRLTPDELAKIHRVAEDQNRAIAQVIRAFIKRAYEERFGNEIPPEPKLRHNVIAKSPPKRLRRPSSTKRKN